MTYTELQVTSHFSFLRGASSAEELFAAAANLGFERLGITDRNSVAGMVRAHLAARTTEVRLVAGCRLDLMDGSSLLVWPQDRAAWSRLTRLLSIGKGRADPRRGEKGQCFLHWEDVAAWSDGLVAAIIPGEADETTATALAQTAEIFGSRAHLCLTLRRRPGEMARLHALDRMARRHGVRSLATGDVLYHSPDKRLLQDVVTAIREKCTIDALGFRRERFADRHLKAAHEMERLFRNFPDAVRAGADIADRCTFSLDELSYQYPDEVVMTARTPQEALERLSREALAARFPGGPPDNYRQLLEHELRLVGELGYAPYFLTVNSIVAYARSQDILCQGRGSAANSMICFMLGITSIDPIKHTLLFERFISGERKEPPDIDVDFEHERREDVIQWIYETYGRNHAALTAVVSRYRARGAVRDVGKALGLPEDLTGALAGQVWGWSNEGVAERHVEELGLDGSDERLQLTLDLARQLIGAPRHMSQHPGGFVLTRDRLDDLVPIEPAAMEDRQVIEWDKDDIETLRFMKVDVLGLGMLGCMRRAFELLDQHKSVRLDLSSPVMQEDDPIVYDMICRADTLGTFQIESRAQMSMLPRMKPRRFYDIVIEVAIVRPGPIQGDMVHPYLRRREGKEPVDYPSEALREVLEKTLGVPLFQEQAMRVAIVGAGFTPAEADGLRRAMATFKYTGGVSHFQDKLVKGMLANGYPPDFAERTFKQIEGFGSYGFPESHAASFAKIAYASCWMKCHHPDIFCAALLNAQPMGFYAPAQIVRDAREHGVEMRPVCINASRWDCTLEDARSSPSLLGEGVRTSDCPRQSEIGSGGPDLVRTHAQHGGGAAPQARNALSGEEPPLRAGPSTAFGGPPPLQKQGRKDMLPLRLGLRMVRGLSNLDAARILAAREERPFSSIDDVWRRSGVPAAALEKLADADAFQSLGLGRRQALWEVRALGASPLPLFAAADAREGQWAPEGHEPQVALRPLREGREVVEDYRAVQLSLRAHPLTFLRPQLAAEGRVTAGDLLAIKDGRKVKLAGIVLIRQRPGSANNVTFVTIEDETGVANIIIWQRLFEAQRRVVLSAAMMGVAGRLQKEGGVIHVIADDLRDMSPELRAVGGLDFPHRTGPGDGAKNGGYDAREKSKALPPPAAPKEREPVKARDLFYPAFRPKPYDPGADTPGIKVKSRDFH